MALKRSAAHIAFFSFVKGISCARRRAAAMRERLPAPAARGMAGMVCTKACLSYFQGASAPIASTGRQGNCCSACAANGVRCGADAECSFPDGHAHRGRRREQGERPGRGVRTRVPYGVWAEVSAAPGSHLCGVNFPGNVLHPTSAIMGLYLDLVQFFRIIAPAGCLHISRKETYARLRNKISGFLK